MSVVALALCACGTGHAGSGNHSLTDVKSAMHAVGLDGFKTISKATMREGKQPPGVRPDQIDGAFDFVHVGTAQTPASVVAVVVVVVNDRRVISRLERADESSVDGPRMRFRHFQAGNVVILALSENPDPTGRRTLARIRTLLSYLRAH
jgi:hypothetical protein